MDQVTVSGLHADFASEQGVRGRQPYAIFQIGYARFHTGPLKVRELCLFICIP